MNLKYLHRLLEEHELLSLKIEQFILDEILKKSNYEKNEIAGHLIKADYNLGFVTDNIKLKYYDWCIVGCYYACYHAALSLIMSRGYMSKSHDATLCVMIKEFYKKGLGEEDILLINNSGLDYHEIIFYVQSKQQRELASYSASLHFSYQQVIDLRIKSSLFIEKVKEIIKQSCQTKIDHHRF